MRLEKYNMKSLFKSKSSTATETGLNTSLIPKINTQVSLVIVIAILVVVFSSMSPVFLRLQNL